MLTSFIILTLVVVLADASKIPVVSDDIDQVVAVHEEEAAAAKVANKDESLFERMGKQSIFAQFARVTPTNCSAASGLDGVCKTQVNCERDGGEADGVCGQAFAVCCVYSPRACGSQLRTQVGYIESEDYPEATTEDGTCTYSIAKYATNVVQLKIEFVDVELAGPINGECGNESIIITDVDYPNPMRTQVCGSLTDSDPIYLSVEDQTVDAKIILNIDENSEAKWRIKVTQLTADEAAPSLCLKYMTESEGAIRSFNHQGGEGEWIGNMNYATCIKPKSGFCDVVFTANHFDIGDGKLCFGTECVTGSEFPASLVYNCTSGPLSFPYSAGDTNDDSGTGYDLTYMLLPSTF